MKRNNTQVSTARVELGRWELTIREHELDRLATMANHSMRADDLSEAIAWIIRAWAEIVNTMPVEDDEPWYREGRVLDILTSLVQARDDHRFIEGLQIERKEADDVR